MKDETQPEQRLWAAVLARLLDDAQCFRRGVLPPGTLDHTDAETAHLELLHCGPHLRYVCGYLDVEAVTVSEAYRRLCGEAEAA